MQLDHQPIFSCSSYTVSTGHQLLLFKHQNTGSTDQAMLTRQLTVALQGPGTATGPIVYYNHLVLLMLFVVFVEPVCCSRVTLGYTGPKRRTDGVCIAAQMTVYELPVITMTSCNIPTGNLVVFSVLN